MTYAIALKPFQGAKFCGDQAAVWEDPDQALICMVDGLGHGKDAEIAAKAAIAYVGENRDQAIDDIFVGCDSAISHTRGVAMGLAWVDKTSQDMLYAAVGNTRAAIADMGDQYIGGIYGIVGAGIQKPIVEPLRFTRKQTIYMWSDGMAESLDFRKYQKQRNLDLESLAFHILDDNADLNADDGSIVIYRKA